MNPAQRERLREDLWDQYSHLETRLSSLRRIIAEDAQDVDEDEINAWAERAQGITQAIDVLVGATYEYLTMRKT